MKSKKSKVNILHVYSESGDHYYYQTSKVLTDDEILTLLREEFDSDWLGENGPGIGETYMHADYLDISATKH